jgi:hypothetical protein
VTTIVLFILFAGGSVAFHEHFARKKERLTVNSVSEVGITAGSDSEPANLDAPSAND